MSDNRPNVYREEDRIVFRASSVGGAEKPLIAMLMGFDPQPPPPGLQKAFDFGNEHEDLLRQAWLSKHPAFELVDEQAEVELDVDEHITIRGHGDGIVKNKFTDELWVLELKWLGKDLFHEVDTNGTEGLFSRLPQYEDQVAVYSAAYGSVYNQGMMPVFYVCGSKQDLKERGVVSWHEETIEDLGHLAEVLDQTFRRCQYIVERAEDNDLPVECDCSGWCPTSYLHEDTEHFITGADAETLTELATRYSDLRLEIEVLKAQKEEAKRQLSECLARLGMDSAETPGAKVTWVRQERTTLDKKAMEEDGIDLSKYQKTYKREYLRVTNREAD